MTFLRRFAGFWYDFLVGDHWELFVGPIAALAVVWLAVGAGLAGPAAGLLLVALIAGVAASSVALAVR